MKIITNSADQTIQFGKKLAKKLKPGDVLGLTGGLGAGKTTLVKGIARGLGLKNDQDVTSPSFVLIKEYNTKPPLYHFDLYRLDNALSIEQLGVEEYLFDRGVCVIEWADKMKMLFPDYTKINLKVLGENKREITVE